MPCYMELDLFLLAWLDFYQARIISSRTGFVRECILHRAWLLKWKGDWCKEIKEALAKGLVSSELRIRLKFTKLQLVNVQEKSKKVGNFGICLPFLDQITSRKGFATFVFTLGLVSVKWGSLAYTTSTVCDICTFAVLCSVTQPLLSLHSCLWRALVLCYKEEF